MLVTLLFILAVAATVRASEVSVANPVNNQLPLIARIGQSYSWSLSQNTFVSLSNDTLTYSTSVLPSWLTFDSSTQSFHGTPSASDEGNPEITVTAHDSTSSASSLFTLCVTHFPAPDLRIPIAGQFYPNNPSLSSVFLIEDTSALLTSNPALRVPPRWSFSIGFEGDTFTSANTIYYEALQADGSPLPSWITFDSDSVTFDGVAPHEDTIPSPDTLSFALYASDQEGYTAASLPFDLIVAEHELSVSQHSLPTINITASTPFSLTLSSPADFSGIYIDEEPLQPANVTAMSIDTSQYQGWLKYDEVSMTLSGQPPSNLKANHDGSGPTLPVTLTANINQTLHTNISLAIVPSYFLSDNLDDIIANPGEQFFFSLTSNLSNSTAIASQQTDVNLTASFDPNEVTQYLSFDSGTGQLTGTIPAESQLDYNHITVTFTAYSRVTHSTSHTSLVIAFSASKVGPGTIKHGHLGSLSIAARKRLILGLGITFGSIGGLFVIGIFLAVFRRCAMVEDSVIDGEEGTRGWTEDEKKYYGIGVDVQKIAQDLVDGYGYGYSKHADGSDTSEKGSLEAARPTTGGNPFEPELISAPREQYGPKTGGYGQLGLGLRRFPPRSPSAFPPSSRSGVMSKGEFVGKLKETARNVSDKVRKVSDKYTRMRARRIRPVIGRPMLVTRSANDANGVSGSGLPLDTQGQSYAPLTFPYGHFEGSKRTSLTESPTSSSGGRSIPVRRADFASPRFPRGPQQPSPARLQARRGSVSSLATHAEEATLHTVSRATSVRSANSITGTSQSGNPHGERPRVVQFTNSTRVPVPKLPSGQLNLPDDQDTRAVGTAKRVASQTAKVFNASVIKKQGSSDGLNLGMHYVNTYGETVANPTFDTGKPRVGKENAMLKVKVKTGEKFTFRVHVTAKNGEHRKLEAKLISGEPLPAFLLFDLKGYGSESTPKKAVEFCGTPGPRDIGEFSVGVYDIDSKECLATVTVQVV